MLSEILITRWLSASVDVCVTSCLPFVDLISGNRCVSYMIFKWEHFKHTWCAVCARWLSSSRQLWLRTNITRWFVFVLWSFCSENVNGSLVGKCELDASHVFSLPSAKVCLCFFPLPESKYVQNLLYPFSMYALKTTNYRTVLFWKHQLKLFFFFEQLALFSGAVVNLKQLTVAQLRAIELMSAIAQVSNTILFCQQTGPRTEKWNWIFTGAFLGPAFLWGVYRDQWQWPRQEEGNLTFSWGLKPLLWMAGVNTSNQEQMFGFLTWPSPFHGNVENSGSDSACMPYSKCPGSTSVVLPLWDSYFKVQRLHGNRGSPGACLVLSSIRDDVTDHLELFIMPYHGIHFLCW